jgi:hypothetical protein
MEYGVAPLILNLKYYLLQYEEEQKMKRETFSMLHAYKTPSRTKQANVNTESSVARNFRRPGRLIITFAPDRNYKLKKINYLSIFRLFS